MLDDRSKGAGPKDPLAEQLAEMTSDTSPRQPAPSDQSGIAATLICPACGNPWADRSYCPHDGTLRQAGVVVGERYELEQLLGAGGMGFVYAARHRLLGKRVAIKVLRQELCNDAQQVGRFLREAKLCSQLHHDNIVDIFDFGRDEAGHLYLVMELLTGTTLEQLLQQRGPMPAKQALAVLRQLCRALDSAHSAGVIHRDLTPRNIFLTSRSGRDDLVKLLDFGISRMAAGDDRVTATGVALGTTPYMPPEQLRGEQNQDHRVDVYALGVIIYELLTGRPPFKADTPADLIVEKLQDAGMDLAASELSRSAPSIAQLVNECISPDPGRRPASVAEVEQRLLTAGGRLMDQPDDLAGVRAGSYRLVKLLGSGGLGSVWVGEHPVIGSRVAVKILHAELCEHEEAIRRFVVEAQAVNRIESPHIVKTFDFGKLPDGRDYAVMELLEGQTLAQRLELSGRMPWANAAAIAVQLAQALLSAHQAGFSHAAQADLLLW
jgi:serine/threonine protein kinase